MEFNTGYIMPMDRDYGGSSTSDVGTNDVGIAPIKDIGFSVPFGIAAPNVQGVAARIRTGARLIELQFPGAGRSQRNAQTPGIYGKRSRQALEELSRANNVDFTTHASFGVMGLSGMDQQGNFSKQSKKFAVDEIKRAIDFAGDVARGGNVVVHTGEFQRPISEEDWAVDPNTGRQLFQSHAEEPERAIFRVVDERSGQIVTQARKNQKVARPLWRKANPGDTYIDKNGQERIAEKEVFLDYYGKEVTWLEERVPEYNPKSGRFEVEYWDWEDFKKEAKTRTKEARKFWRENKDKPEKFAESIYYPFRNATSEEEIEVYPEEAYVQATLETNAANAKGWALYYGGRFDKQLEQVKKLKELREYYSKEEKKAENQGRLDFLKREVNELGRQVGIDLPGTREYKLPTELIDDALNVFDRQMEQSREASTAQQQQAAEAYEQMRHLSSHRRYALGEAFGAYAEAGMHAMRKSDALKKRGKLKQPIFVAMENIFPESFGGHPEELMKLVKGARGAMIDRLIEKGYSKEQAMRASQDHIKGHLDTGHLNMWRKYWVWDKNLSPEQNDQKFNEWALKKVEMMAKEKMIGSVHLTDNWGYQDEHLSPGEGNTPTVALVKMLKKHGYEGPLVVEPGADATTDLSDFHGLMKTWRLFGSSIYGMGIGGRSPPQQGRQWGQVQYSYFGQGNPPYFVFGRYSPSEDWTLWSGVPME